MRLLLLPSHFAAPHGLSPSLSPPDRALLSLQRSLHHLKKCWPTHYASKWMHACALLSLSQLSIDALDLFVPFFTIVLLCCTNTISYSKRNQPYCLSLLLCFYGYEKKLLDMATKCRCLFTCPNNVHNGTCDLQPEGYCFTGVQTIFNQEKGILENETIYGCLPPTEGSILQVVQF